MNRGVKQVDVLDEQQHMMSKLKSNDQLNPKASTNAINHSLSTSKTHYNNKSIHIKTGHQSIVKLTAFDPSSFIIQYTSLYPTLSP